MSEPCWFNGESAPGLPAGLRALHYGDGVFRTCLNWNGVILDLDEHLDHLRRDARQLGMSPPDREILRQDLQQAVDATPSVLKLTLSRRAGGRGYRAQDDGTDRIVMRSTAPRYPAAHWSRGVRLRDSELRLAIQPALAGIKHLNRLEQVLASREFRADDEELLMRDSENNIVCGTRSNLFWVHGGVLHTPGLRRCGVAGVMRGRILRIAARIGLETRLCEAARDSLLDADEILLSNSLIGVWPVRRYQDRALSAPGPVTARIDAELAHPRLS